GWAYEREQGTPGVACVAVAVDYRIPATDAISCSMPAGLSPTEVEKITDAVIKHTRKLAATLRREGIR
ncbi:MAG TPA: IclR family transcriptional regulator, partial [Nonomuraea sp.]|nr:IclR family transcriptional regulator [Nonomuraea sp.]